MARALSLLESISRARDYTLHLLSGTSPADWFWMPREGVTHIAWQVGHLAFAQYRLALERVRGERPDDEPLLPMAFREKFGRGSVPVGDPTAYPTVAEIRHVFNAVHRQVLEEIRTLGDATLDQPTATSHSRFSTKGGSLAWCAEHEMIHAGQIGLLRRLQGRQPLW
jgi:hypothetical protein